MKTEKEENISLSDMNSDPIKEGGEIMWDVSENYPIACVLTPENNELIIRDSHLADLAYLIDVAAQDQIDQKVIDSFVKRRVVSRNRNITSSQELDRLQRGIRNLYDTVVEAVIKYRELAEDCDVARCDMNQPKYKVSAAAKLLKIERATLNNWTNQKGGSIKCYELDGTAKFILEEDLKIKYKELTGRELIIDDNIRQKYQYKSKII